MLGPTPSTLSWTQQPCCHAGLSVSHLDLLTLQNHVCEHLSTYVPGMNPFLVSASHPCSSQQMGLCLSIPASTFPTKLYSKPQFVSEIHPEGQSSNCSICEFLNNSEVWQDPGAVLQAKVQAVSRGGSESLGVEARSCWPPLEETPLGCSPKMEEAAKSAGLYRAVADRGCLAHSVQEIKRPARRFCWSKFRIASYTIQRGKGDAC